MRPRRHVIVICTFAFSYLLTTARVAGDLIPRTPLPKTATITRPAYDSELTVKFRDDLKVRAVDGSLISLVGGDLESIESITTQFGLTFEQLIQLPQETLDSIETRAAQRCGVAQPDLAGMMLVFAPDESVEAAAQALLPLDEVEWAQFVMLNPELPQVCAFDSEGPNCPVGDPCPPGDPGGDCCDICPDTCHYFPERSNDPGSEILDYHGPDPGLDMTCAWEYGARGQGIQIADCERGYILGTEDLCGINMEPGVTPCPKGPPGWFDHGSAVLGEMVALDNGYGWTGLVPDATAWMFHEFGVQDPGTQCVYRRHTAIANAINTVDPGDIVLLEMQTSIGGGLNLGPAELDSFTWQLTCCATQSGIIVVAAAGNGDQDLDSTDYEEYMSRVCQLCPGGQPGDSGAIIVGAGSADTNHDKLSFSTYGSRVNVQGWGENVFTLGFGSYAEHGGDERQRYMDDFGGTSSAAPFVAGAAAALQSLHVAEFGYILEPLQMRQLLIDTGIAQGTGGHIGPFPNMAAAILSLGVASDCNTDGIPDECQAATISAARSCRTHGSPVEFCLDLGNGPINNIEPRLGGPQEVEFDLDLCVNTVQASVSCVNNTYGGTIDVTTSGVATIRVTFTPGLPDRDCCTITLTGDANDDWAVRTLVADVNRDGGVSFADYSSVEQRLGALVTSSNFQYDVNVDGAISSADLSSVQQRLGRVAPACSNGGGESAGSGGGGPEGEVWTSGYANVSLEVWPVGGTTPVTVLAPNTTYEVHYETDYTQVNTYVLFAVASSVDHGFAAATAPPAGDWAGTGNFMFVDITTEPGGPLAAVGYPQGYYRYHMAADRTWSSGPSGSDHYAGPKGHLCNITTQSAGDLNLHLYMSWIDQADQVIVDMETQVQLPVVSVSAGE